MPEAPARGNTALAGVSGVPDAQEAGLLHSPRAVDVACGRFFVALDTPGDPVLLTDNVP
jgi:hypothetical protein